MKGGRRELANLFVYVACTNCFMDKLASVNYLVESLVMEWFKKVILSWIDAYRSGKKYCCSYVMFLDDRVRVKLG